MKNKIQYKAHILMHSRYKLLITLTINLLIIYIYNLSTDNIDVVECMKRAKPSEPSDMSDIDKVTQLTYDNIILKDQLEALTQKLDNELTEYQSRIKELETNQLHLIQENRQLQEQLNETNRNLGRIAGDNMELRAENIILKRSNNILRRELEIVQQHEDSLLEDLLRK